MNDPGALCHHKRAQENHEVKEKNAKSLSLSVSAFCPGVRWSAHKVIAQLLVVSERGEKTMKGPFRKPWRWLQALALIAGMLFALSGCATGPRLVLHSFSFDGRHDKWAENIDLLAYSYGDQYRMVRDDVDNPSHPISKGKSALAVSMGVNGFIPVGDFLRVKWRIKATGEVLEDRVDLRGRLPADMNKHGVTFVIDGRQLYVFVVTPTPITVNLPKPPKRTWLSRHTVTYEIYPNNELK